MSAPIAERGVNRGALDMIGRFLADYPRRTLGVLLALLVAGMLEGLGLSTLLSMLSIATGTGEDPSLPERVALDTAALLGLEASLFNLLLLGLTLLLFKAVAVLLANRMVGYAVAQVATDLRLDLIRAIMGSRWRYYLSKSVGSLSNAIATEAQRASEGYLHAAMTATQLFGAIILTTVAFMIDWRITLGAVAAGSVLLGGLNVLVRMAGRAGRRQTGLLKSILTDMTDQLSAVKPLKAMGREEHVDGLLSNQAAVLNRALRKQVFSREAMHAVQEPLLAILAAVGLFILLVPLEMNLAEVMVLIFLLARSVNHLAKAQRAWQLVALNESAYWSLVGAIEEARAEREPPRGRLEPKLERAIRFDRVSFSHGDLRVLEEQSLEIPAGALTVITGPSGAGKTTLIDLVAGLLRPDAGRVLIDGVALEEIDHGKWRRLIGYVPQEAHLVNDTVMRNITLGEPGLDVQAVRRALAEADALAFVEAMPGGLEATVGERGGRLSGGQRQRLAIARALVHRPKLLILDEATSNLDGQAERAVLATIDRLRRRLTLLAVTHQKPMAELADRVYRIEAGRVDLVRTEPAPA